MILMQLSAMGLSFLSAVSSVALLGVSAYIIAAASLQPELYTLALPITVVRACGILRAVLRYGERYVGHNAAFAFAGRVNQALFGYLARVLPLRLASAGENQGMFVERLNNEAGERRNLYLRGITPLVVNFLLSLTAGGALYLSDGFGGWWAALPTACCILVVLISYAGEKRQADIMLQRGGYRRQLLDMQAGMPELLVTGAADWAAGRLDMAAAQLMEADRRRGRCRTLTELAVRLCLVVTFCALFVRLLQAGSAGAICFIETAVMAVSLQAVLAEFATLEEAVKALLSAGKIKSLEKGENSVQRGEKSSIMEDNKVGLEAEHIVFSYDRKNLVLDNLSFVVYKGEKAAVLGDSGSGKTTLFNLVLGMWQPDGGCFRGELSQNGVAVSAVTQAVYIFDATIGELFQRLCPCATQAQLWHALELARLDEVVRSKPEGLSCRLGKNACRLSGGERQRLLTALAAARAMSEDTPLLLLDEPTCGLDRQTASCMMASLLAAFADRTMLVITHDEYVAEMFEKRILL
ncbi:amino acid ABC transporter ATP-binding/permease protein [Anaerovibrio sp.]|uniref:amino acid ABC transporter ATP-binding/permease protein n=1 Tax=Anaerovibrio sp. TaxID=1872532 RepID=UPI003F16AE14